jgi:adenylylsulfate kinase
MTKHAPEQVRRSIAKAITFRIVILISDSLIIYALTHRFDLTLDMMVLSNVASTLIYIVHERAWTRIGWGRK